MKISGRIITGGICLAVVLGIAACGSSASSAEQTSAATEEISESAGSEVKTEEAYDTNEAGEDTGSVTMVKVAFNQTIKPVAYLDDDGNPTGSEVELFKLIDEKLPEYEFEYYGTSDDDLLLGLTTGQYDVGLKNSYYTEERAKTYIIPETYDGAAKVGLIIRSEDADRINGFEDVAAYGFKLNPLNPADANYTNVVNYNNDNPDNQIEIEEADSLIYYTEGINWLLEGRIDALLVPESHYNTNIKADDGAYHEYVDQLSFVTIYGKATYPLFAQGQEDLAAAYEKAMAELDAEGRVAEVIIEFFGEDARTYVE